MIIRGTLEEGKKHTKPPITNATSKDYKEYTQNHVA